MHHPFSIRTARENDAESISRLTGELGYVDNFPAIHHRLEAILTSTADRLFVAEDESAIMLGWLQAHAAHIIESGFRVEIVGLIVSATARRRGVGRALVAAAEQWAKTLSAEAVVVRTNIQRLESQAFYPALGYSTTKTQVVYRKPIQ